MADIARSKELVGLINKLQDAFTVCQGTMGSIKLPQIAVVGGQSSGKSSVLENFVGKDFLPRGNGIVTRRPLVLQLVQTPGSKREYGVFLHKPGKEYDSFAQIRREIAAETDRTTGDNKGISEKPINLKIFSPDVLNLTLIDLPGITRVPVGDQPEDIEDQIKRMIVKYIREPTCIILAVSPANLDLANSDGINLAKTYDPEGSRTIGVITKLDLMDRGTDAYTTLTNNGEIPLKLGYVGVVNRSQADINERKSMRDAWKAETKYFQSHPKYRRIADKCGIKHLGAKLSALLTDKIQESLPKIQKQIEKFLETSRRELEGFTFLDGKQRHKMLLQLLVGYCESFKGILDGTRELVDDQNHGELRGGAHIQAIFGDLVRDLGGIEILRVVPPRDFKTTVKNCIGVGTGLFTPTETFELIIRRGIQEMETPAIRCLDEVHDELITIVSKAQTGNLKRFRALSLRMGEVVKDIIRCSYKEAKTLLHTILRMEQTQVNTNHPDFVGSRRTLGQLIAKVSNEVVPQDDDDDEEEEENDDDDDGDSSDEDRSLAKGAELTSSGDQVFKIEIIETILLKKLLKSYFRVVRKKVADSIPKAIQLKLIDSVREKMQSELVGSLYTNDENEIVELMADDPAMEKRKKHLDEAVKLLEIAEAAIYKAMSSSGAASKSRDY